VQAVFRAHDTPLRPLKIAPWGMGEGWVDQLRRFHRSTNGGVEHGPEPQSGRVCQDPTAVHTFFDDQDTPFSALLVVLVAPSGVGVGWMVQLLPFQRSASGSPEHGSPLWGSEQPGPL
jgi:hypothetical protein